MVCQNGSPTILEFTVKLQSFETGIQRLYYVAWILFSLGFLAAGATMFFYEHQDKPIGDAEIVEAWLFILGVTIGPWIAMRAVRWIYRGFIPVK